MNVWESAWRCSSVPSRRTSTAICGATAARRNFSRAREYKQRWGFDWSLYKPIVDFCRHNKVPLAALNAPKELTSRISKVAFAGLNDEEKKQLGPIDFHLKEHRDHWYERLAKMHGDSKAPRSKRNAPTR